MDTLNVTMIFPMAFVIFFYYLDQSIIVSESIFFGEEHAGVEQRVKEGNSGVALKKINILLLTFQLVQQEKDDSELLRERKPPCALEVDH